MLTPERSDLYQSIRQQIGNTPFRELVRISVPNRCRIVIKEEYRNPSGSHYDREMWHFLRAKEDEGLIEPGSTRMLETTTGNSGSSFAWLCMALGYPSPVILIPADMPQARIAQIRQYGAEVVLSEPGLYITGLSELFRDYAIANKEKARSENSEPLYRPRHWADTVHTVRAMEELGAEILDDAAREDILIDHFVLALGNGASARGVGTVLKSAGKNLIGMEPAESPIVEEYLRGPEALQRGITENRSHGIIGTGPFRAEELYDNVKEAAPMLSAIMHPTTDDCLEVQRELISQEGLHVGMSSAGCLWSIRKYIDQLDVKSQTFGMICYDPAWKYLSWKRSRLDLLLFLGLHSEASDEQVAEAVSKFGN